jgi:hypothetical protein
MPSSDHTISRRTLIAGTMGLGITAVRPRTVAAVSANARTAESVSVEQVKRIIETFSALGEPLPVAETKRMLTLVDQPSGEGAVELEGLLERHTLIRLELGKTGVGKSTRGGATPSLRELGWRTFLVRVTNPARLTGPVALYSSAAIPEGAVQGGIHDSHILGNDLPEVVRLPPDLDTDFEVDGSRWMGYRFGGGGPLNAGLNGQPIEYGILQLYSQQGGVNRAQIFLASAMMPPLQFVECQGADLEFTTLPACTVTLVIRDADGAGTTASLLIRDRAGRLYPAPAHRLEPDLAYQPEIFRAHGETVRLPLGRYQVTALRGPEYLATHQDFDLSSAGIPVQWELELTRWIDPTLYGWYPGDPHIHPEGQTFGAISKYGLTPETMLRQVRGEALSVGSILIWAGGYYYEKQFLTGHAYEATYGLPFPDVQRANNITLTPKSTPHDSESLIRYDVEQAAFPSNRLGHPVLLRLKNHDYPGARSLYEWPSWNLPVLQWAKDQGAVAGYAHCGYGMPWNSLELPNYVLPSFESLGANECLVDVTHGAVDFVAGGETHPVMELNFWYHLLNCGFRLPMVGETDFHWAKSRVGTSRTYVKIDRGLIGDTRYDAWVEGIREGRLYFGDGRSHLIDFRANDHAVGGGNLELPGHGHVVMSAMIAARLEENPVDANDERMTRPNSYWHLERARIGSSRTVPLEVIVNGQVVARCEVLADGKLRRVSLAINVAFSSWVALRILPSSHSAPIYVSVAGRPVRVSRRSAQWCLGCLDVLWGKHAKRIRESERATAAAAWDHARNVYRRILGECSID